MGNNTGLDKKFKKNISIVPCKNDCIYFNYKGDIPICRLKNRVAWDGARDNIVNECTDCTNYKREYSV